VVAIEPGFFATSIYDDQKRPTIDRTSPYAAMVSNIDEAVATGIGTGGDPAAVATAIIAAVDDETSPTCVLVGDDAIAAFNTYRQQVFASWQDDPRGTTT